ncbi:MAG: hypothetical protein IID34_00795 [Planctomycetes bacterium]|nr:hypothetical protein [Planctomycetota bacterium]MCH8969107.1 hypothetical protein [Planctomycetota bacterium]
MYYDRCLKLRPLAALLVILSVVGLGGCGAAETAAVFSGGGATDNPLDGGVLSDDGQDFRLSTDGATLSQVEISSGAEIGFDRGLTEVSQVAAIDRILTADGNSAEYDAQRQTLTINANVAGQSISFTTNTGDILNGVFGSTTARASSQNSTDCDTIVASVSAFCDSYIANVAAAEAEIIALALQVAEESGIPPLFFGVVEQLIKDYFKVVDDFCDAWDELTSGTDPTNPCDVVG